MNALRLAPLCVALAAACSVSAAQVKVSMSEDVIYLRDGTLVTGTILVQGARAIIILTDKGEEVVSTEQVERVVRRPGSSGPKTFATTVKDGFHRVLPIQVEAGAAPAVGASSAAANLRVEVEKPPAANARPTGKTGNAQEKTVQVNPPAVDQTALEEWLKKALEEAKRKDLLKEFKAAQ